VLGHVSVEYDVVEGYDWKASACVEGVPTHQMTRAMERFDAIGRMKPSRETAPATAPPSPKATMTHKILTRFGEGVS
jgi:hypothetical protein